MSNDFSNLADAGRACCNCGRTSDKVRLKKLRTYSRSYACSECYVKHWNCGNKNPLGNPCNHAPNQHQKTPKGDEHIVFSGPCEQAGCGCAGYIHSLESELDRQYANCVGLEPRIKECGGYGQNLGKCGRLIFLGADGTLGRLCPTCEASWMRETMQGMQEAGKVLDLVPGRPEGGDIH